jgi:hypothetical protein
LVWGGRGVDWDAILATVTYVCVLSSLLVASPVKEAEERHDQSEERNKEDHSPDACIRGRRRKRKKAL